MKWLRRLIGDVRNFWQKESIQIFWRREKLARVLVYTVVISLGVWAVSSCMSSTEKVEHLRYFGCIGVFWSLLLGAGVYVVPANYKQAVRVNKPKHPVEKVAYALTAPFLVYGLLAGFWFLFLHALRIGWPQTKVGSTVLTIIIFIVLCMTTGGFLLLGIAWTSRRIWRWARWKYALRTGKGYSPYMPR